MSVKSKVTQKDVLDFIQDTATRAQIEEISVLARNVRKSLAEDAAYELKYELAPGDTVRIRETALLRPKGLLGVTGKVDRVLNTRCSVLLDKSVGRFVKGVPVRVPLDSLEKV